MSKRKTSAFASVRGRLLQDLVRVDDWCRRSCSATRSRPASPRSPPPRASPGTRSGRVAAGLSLNMTITSPPPTTDRARVVDLREGEDVVVRSPASPSSRSAMSGRRSRPRSPARPSAASAKTCVTEVGKSVWSALDGAAGDVVGLRAPCPSRSARPSPTGRSTGSRASSAGRTSPGPPCGGRCSRTGR